MKKIKLLVTDDEYLDFMDLLEHSMYSIDPTINGIVAEIILKKIEEY